MQSILIFAVIVVFKVTVDTELENTVPIFPEESQGYVPSSLKLQHFHQLIST